MGVTQNYKTAALWYGMASKQDFVPSQQCMARLYDQVTSPPNFSRQILNFPLCFFLQGKGVEQNYETSATWWAKAAAQGDAVAQV